MNILSYRGPGAGGGVSSALSRLMNNLSGLTSVYTERTSSVSGDCSSPVPFKPVLPKPVLPKPVHPVRWWHLDGSDIKDCFGNEFISRLGAEVIAGHYRYCNEFLWPVLHDMPQYAHYSGVDHGSYAKFNQQFARLLKIVRRQTFLESTSRSYFVHDYQLAIVPALLRRARLPALQVSIFWHIPWPKIVEARHCKAIRELALCLIESDVIGFHTLEYALNFLGFIERQLPGAKVKRQSLSIKLACGRSAKLKVSPLGLDLSFWERGAQCLSAGISAAKFASKFGRYVLSVDRCDYTKGVLPRLAAIERFFERWPEQRGNLTFVQICQRTRAGLASFDDYYTRCASKVEDLNNRIGRDDWRPLVWIKDTISQDELIDLYRSASAMLINPIRDGLNLTAKEFAGSCTDLISPGTLLLSRGAGVFQELGEYAIEVEPNNLEQMSTAISQALVMPESVRRNAISLMRKKLAENTLEEWWQDFTFEEVICGERAESDKALQWFTSTKLEAIVV